MLENFFRKSKTEKEQGPERVVELGKKALLIEASSEIEPERSGGHMLCTVFAMALAMGMTAGAAEAQVRGIGPQGQSFGSQFAGEVFHQGVFEIGSAVNRGQNAKQETIERKYVAQLTQLEDAQRQLDTQCSNQRDRLMREEGNQGKLKTLEDNYRAEKVRLAMIRVDVEKEYHRQKRNTSIKRGLAEAVFQGARGW